MVAIIATAVAAKMPKYLNAMKNKITGNKSNKNFIWALKQITILVKMPKTNLKQSFRQERYFAMISYTPQGVNCNKLNSTARCNRKG
jgi:hypothetical protein